MSVPHPEYQGGLRLLGWVSPQFLPLDVGVQPARVHATLPPQARLLPIQLKQLPPPPPPSS
eukprot:8653541-Prorocentrum_lima.AAC.1